MTTTPTSAPPANRLARVGRTVAVRIWAVAVLCWLATAALVVVGGSGLGHHDIVLERSDLSWPLRLAAFAAVWLVMVGAMMLPTTVPMLQLFWAVSARSPRPGSSRAVFVVAYLAVWTGFALVALAGDALVHALVDSVSWLATRPGLVLAGTLLLAGAFQFSSLKEACLTACRSPMSLLWGHYRRGPGGAWALGVRHGMLCLGCCWALMLVMFATGVGSLLWMLLLAGVMVVEKTVPWGARMVAPTGAAFIAGGIAVGATTFVAPL